MKDRIFFTDKMDNHIILISELKIILNELKIILNEKCFLTLQ